MAVLYSRAMWVEDFAFDLPAELIAQYPRPSRTASRLLVLEGGSGTVHDRHFCDLPELLGPGDLLVLNDTRVIPARLLGHKSTGGRVEILMERLLDERRALAQLRASKPPRAHTRLLLRGGVELQVVGRREDLYELELQGAAGLSAVLDAMGRVPLPPYIEREPEPLDGERYQTVYARHRGAVAAPTAGLHFDQPMLERLSGLGVGLARVTLHVGAGTFQPVRVARVEDHRMHSEHVDVPEQTCARVRAARERGGRVIAVGTTSVRSLEAASRGGDIARYAGETDIFIYPGYRFHSVDALITNFHLPGSTLLMLVCAFAGTRQVLAAYRHAVARRYRFCSYGDAMLVTPSGG